MTTEKNIAHVLGLEREPLGGVLSLLDRNGEQARVIGGAVRNALLGLAVAEIDIATTAVPEEVIRRCTAAGFNCVPTGIEHGTVTVIASGVPFEVTTLRQDVETYGRKAKVEFGRDWRADAERRDFTINALSVSRDGQVHDYVGGLADIDARRVRFVGEPAVRIAEDYLRILRFFRFHAAYGTGDLDAAGLHASIGARAGLETLSRERIRMELIKLLVAKGAVPTLVVMADAGLLQRVLGGVPLVASLAHMLAIEAAIGLQRDPVRGLAAVAVFTTEDAERLWQRLRLSNAEHARLRSMGKSWWRISEAMDERQARALLYRLGQADFVDRVAMAWSRATADADSPRWRALAALSQRWAAPVFPLKAADFMARGIAQGPALGAVLSKAEEAWIAADFPADASAVQAIADRATASIATS